MSKIVFIAPSEDIACLAREVVQETGSPIDIRTGVMQQGVIEARREEHKGAEVIISRGGTALLIQQSVSIPVVELQVTGYDIVRALHNAKQFGREVGVVGFRNIISRVESVEHIVNVRVRKLLVEDENEFAPRIREAAASGVEVVVGGTVVTALAGEFGIHGVLLSSGKESILEAIEEAKRVLVIRRRARERAEQFRTILQSIASGVVAVDRRGVITVFNPVAEALVGVKAQDAIGRDVVDVIPNTELHRVLKTGKPELGELQQIGDIRIVTSRVPIVTKGEVTGVVATFEDVTKIQKLEQRIRQELATRGHVARYRFSDVLGQSNAIKAAIRKASHYALLDSTILIEAETGAGKEIFAQSIHAASPRSAGPFVAVNCGALPETLLETELFGYVAGAFTGAHQKGKVGLFELAHGGTIFLDEISEMSGAVQARLLRVLQEKEVMRVGDDRVVPVDIRVIAATNRRLDDLVDSGKLREDLYYRLDVLNLRLPPLRERREDIPILAAEFARRSCHRLRRKPIAFSPEAMRVFAAHHWPGNVRHLENVIERLVVLVAERPVMASDIAEVLSVPDKTPPVTEGSFGGEGILPGLERQAILRALDETGGNRTEAAKRLGISKTTLWRRLKEMGER